MNFDRPSIAWVPAISDKDAAEANEDQKAYVREQQEILVAKGRRIVAKKKAAQLTEINQMLSAVTRQPKVAKEVMKWLFCGKITTEYLGKVIKVIKREEHKAPALLIEYMKGKRKL
jgi:hypothetical protein